MTPGSEDGCEDNAVVVGRMPEPEHAVAVTMAADVSSAMARTLVSIDAVVRLRGELTCFLHRRRRGSSECIVVRVTLAGDSPEVTIVVTPGRDDVEAACGEGRSQRLVLIPSHLDH